MVAVGLGLLTIKEGGTILFGNEAARVSGGAYEQRAVITMSLRTLVWTAIMIVA